MVETDFEGARLQWSASERGRTLHGAVSNNSCDRWSDRRRFCNFLRSFTDTKRSSSSQLDVGKAGSNVALDDYSLALQNTLIPTASGGVVVSVAKLRYSLWSL